MGSNRSRYGEAIRVAIGMVVVRLFASVFLLFMAYQIFSNVHPDALKYERLASGRTARAEGTITAILANNLDRRQETTVTQTVRVDFSTISEDKVTTVMGRLGSDAFVGMQVPIRYDPHHPRNSEIVGPVPPSHAFDAFYLLAGALAFGALVNLWSLRPLVAALLAPR